MLKLNISDAKYQAFAQFVKFGIVGLSNTLVSYVIYYFTIRGCEIAGVFQKTDYILATVVSFLLSVLWSFYWNKKYVFKPSLPEVNAKNPIYPDFTKVTAKKW